MPHCCDLGGGCVGREFIYVWGRTHGGLLNQGMASHQDALRVDVPDDGETDGSTEKRNDKAVSGHGRNRSLRNAGAIPE